jgi:hypothetical protein
MRRWRAAYLSDPWQGISALTPGAAWVSLPYSTHGELVSERFAVKKPPIVNNLLEAIQMVFVNISA